MQTTSLLEDCLTPCAMIRTTFEALDLFSFDHPVRQEMVAIIEDARKCLCEQLQASTEHFLTSPESPGLLNSSTRRLLQDGISGKSLNSYLKTNIFSEEETYSLPIDGENLDNRKNSLSLPLNLFFAVQGNVLRLKAEEVKNCSDRLTFEREVFRPLLQLLYVRYSVIDSMFYP